MVDRILNTSGLQSRVVKQNLMFVIILIVKPLLAERLFCEAFWLTVPKLSGITLPSAGGVRLG